MSDSALNLAQALWEEHQVLEGKRLKFVPKQASAASPPPGGATTSADDQTKASAESRFAGEPRETKSENTESADVKAVTEKTDAIKADDGTSAGGAGPEGAVQGHDPMPADLPGIYRKLNQHNRWALCLSGGGIRSAAFGLGILQRLAAQPIASKHQQPGTDKKASWALQQFEYLSTVSGGGYIGSWLSAWLFQERKKLGGTGGADDVVKHLRERKGDEVGPISNLRRHSNYLAPRFSVTSLDLWSGIASVFRNLCLNWILLFPPIILAVLATWLLHYVLVEALKLTEDSRWIIGGLMAFAALLFSVALSFSAANRPARGLINASEKQFLICDLMIFLFGAALFVFVLASPAGQKWLTAVAKRVLRLPDLLENTFPLEVRRGFVPVGSVQPAAGVVDRQSARKFGLLAYQPRFKERPTPATPAPCWAIGHIRYKDADQGDEDGFKVEDGLLLYIKCGLHGTEPIDVLSYAMTHPAFPHETTGNQFFAESQFESYRMLGFDILGRAIEAGNANPGLTFDRVIANLETQQRSGFWDGIYGEAY